LIKVPRAVLASVFEFRLSAVSDVVIVIPIDPLTEVSTGAVAVVWFANMRMFRLISS